MLRKLIIKNVALIDNAEIEFDKGLNILSGETGSGKSVIIDSLNFVLGAKADKTMITYGQDYSFVQAEFDISGKLLLENVFKEFDFEYEETLIISRKLKIDGKSDIKLNGNTVTVAMLRRFTTFLVDIHGQSEHFYLLKENNQLDLIDKYCGDELLKIKEEIRENYSKLKDINAKLLEFGGDEASRAIRLDILSYQIKEIEEADIGETEEDELNILKKKLSNQEKIVEALNFSHEVLSGEGCANDNIQSALREIGQISNFSEVYNALYERLDGLQCDLEDIIENLNNENDKFDDEENNLEEITNRLDIIKKIHKKYGATYNDIVNFLDLAKKEFEKLTNFDELTEKYTIEQSKIQNVLYRSYKNLSEIRKKFASKFSVEVTKELAELGMSKAKFEVAFNEFPLKENINYNNNGQDTLEFLFSANLGEPLKPLAKIISGGEISRFMLAIKTVTAKLQEISTFVFDEIDAGISGKIAEVVSEKFAKIAMDTEVIAITHLPQISAMGDNSLLIYKIESNGKTKSYVKKLDKNDKIYEITRLIGGDKTNEIAVMHAKNLIDKADEYKNNLKKR